MKKLIIINIILILLINIIPDVESSNNLENNTDIISAEITSRSDEPRTEQFDTALISTEQLNDTEELIIEDKTLNGYRITSYYPSDNYGTSNKTGSGKTTEDFNIININGKNVYTYQGRIVVAGATKELLKSGYNKNGSQKKQDKHYFNYGDTGRIKINDIWYGFIVLDSCGASMWENYYRLDIFVPDKNNIIDTKNVEIIYD